MSGIPWEVWFVAGVVAIKVLVTIAWWIREGDER